MWEYLDKNKEWIFSGVGASLFIFLLTYFQRNKRKANSKNIASNKFSINNINMSQKGGKSSTNYQSSGDINIHKEK